MSDFATEVLRERARLAADDPDGESDAVAPLTSVRARQVLLDSEDRERRRRRVPGIHRPIEGNPAATS